MSEGCYMLLVWVQRRRLVKGKMIIEIKAIPVDKEVDFDIKELGQETKGHS
jgi:hypothetical protein